jgi:hypothetical protein
MPVKIGGYQLRIPHDPALMWTAANPSIERTPSSKLRLLPVAADVERLGPKANITTNRR